MGTKPHCGILLTSFNPWTKGLVEFYPENFEPLCRIIYRHFAECQKLCCLKWEWNWSSKAGKFKVSYLKHKLFVEMKKLRFELTNVTKETGFRKQSCIICENL